nr:bHLH55 [Pinus massoniana]
MEMSSAQWCPEQGTEDQTLPGLRNSELPVPTMEELKELIRYQSDLGYEADASLTGYPTNVKLPAKVSCLGVRPSPRYLGYERPTKQQKANKSQDSLFPTFSSEVPTSPIYFRNSQQKLQHNQLENYFTSFFKVKGDETYENVAPTTPAMQAEIVACGEHDHCRISDISRSDMDSAFNDSSSHFSRSNVATGNRHRQSNQVPKKGASGTSQDHIMAERKRREKLSQRFIALSAIVPGLKKMDKASVLGDAIKYVKQLQDRIKALEEQAPKNTVQSVVYLKEELCNYDEDTAYQDSSEIKNSSSSEKCVTGVLSPQIEIRVVHRNVLIHVHCEKRNGLLLQFLAELLKLHLTVVNASVLSFSETTFDLTFNAEMEEGCDLTVKDIAKALQALLE